MPGSGRALQAAARSKVEAQVGSGGRAWVARGNMAQRGSANVGAVAGRRGCSCVGRRRRPCYCHGEQRPEQSGGEE
eukprot:scaffold275999_cov46-Tisochrysis_lutea.AAC.1